MTSGLQWFVVVCGGLPASSLVSLPIVPNSGGDLWRFAVMFGGLRWFVVVCLFVIPTELWCRHQIEILRTNGFQSLVSHPKDAEIHSL